jgi:hypothetical protein
MIDIKRYWIAVILLVGLLSACDEIKDDIKPVVPTNNTAMLWDNRTLYTTPNNMGIISVKDFLKNAIGNALKIEKNGTFGKAYFSANGNFIIYFPDSTVSEATDLLVFKVMNVDTKKEKKDSVWVKIVSNTERIPCNAGVVPDFFQVNNNGQVHILDVLHNDRYCNAILDSASLQITQAPLKGIAQIQNNKIVYLPPKDYDGIDVLFYKVCSGGSTPVCMTAAIKLDIHGATVRPCYPYLLPNYYLIAKNRVEKAVLDVLANDNLCTVYKPQSLQISKKPQYGTATISSDFKVEYKIQNTLLPANLNDVEDGFEYTLTDSTGKVSEPVWVKISLLQPISCDETFDNGVMEVSESKVQYNDFEIPYYLYLSLCTQVSEVSIVSQGTHGIAKVVGKKIYFQIKSDDKDKGKDRDDEFKIQVITTNGKTLKANFKVKIKK